MFLFLLIFLLLCVLYVFMVLPNFPRRKIDHLKGYDYAHRGLWNEALPENSLPAFQNAVDHGFGIELDVHLTRDDHLVVFHDDTSTRMCGIDRPIADCTLAELRQMRLKDSNCTIPTLDEVLQVIGGKVPMIVEIKPDKRIDELCTKTYAAMTAYGGPYCVESFHPLAVRWFRKHAPQVIRGQLSFGPGNGRETTVLFFLLGSLIQNVLGRPDFIAYEAKTDHTLSMGIMRLCRPTLVCWTIHSQEEMDAQRSRYDLEIFDGFVPHD